MTPGKALGLIMRAQGLAQTELAEKSGISAFSINKLCSDKTTMSNDAMEKFSTALGVPIEVFIVLFHNGRITTENQRALAIISALKAFESAEAHLLDCIYSGDN